MCMRSSKTCSLYASKIQAPVEEATCKIKNRDKLDHVETANSEVVADEVQNNNKLDKLQSK